MNKHHRVLVVLTLIVISLTILFSVPVQAKTKISKKSASILVTRSLKLKVSGAKGKVSWSSSNPKIASVKNGKVKGLKPGTTVITAKTGGKKYTCKITVKKGLSAKKLSLTVGSSKKLKLYGTKIKSVKSSNKAVATITKKGTVKAVGAGSCKLTITGKDKKKYRCNVTVSLPAAQTDQPSSTSNTHVVTFVTNGGSAVPSQMVADGGRIPVPTLPVRNRFIFSGWFIDRTLTVRYDFSTLIYSDLTLYAGWSADPSDITRGEWIGILADIIDMNTSADPNAIQYYYNDTAGTAYGVAIETAKGYNLLPAAELKDAENDVPSFHPEQVATREFVAYTAVKAAGYQTLSGEKDIADWVDYDQIQYQDEAYYSVVLGMLALENGYFHPGYAINAIDIENIRTVFQKLNESTTVEGDGRDSSTYQPNVIRDEISSITDYTYQDLGDGTYRVTMPQNAQTLAIQTGNVLILPANSVCPSGAALKVSSVSRRYGNVVLTGTRPELYEIFSHIDLATTESFSGIDGFVPADGVEVSFIPDTSSGKSNLGGSTSIPGKFHFDFLDKKFGSSYPQKWKASGSIDVSIPDITLILDASVWPWDFKVKEFTFSATAEAKVSGKVSYTIAESGYQRTDSPTSFEGGRVELGRKGIPIGYTGFFIDFVFYYNVSAKGEASITYTADLTLGGQYKDGEFRSLNKYSDSLDMLELKASGTAGAGISVMATYLEVWDIVGWYAEAGVGFNGSFTPHVLVQENLYCGDISIYGYFKTGLDTETIIGDFVKSKLHYELEFEYGGNKRDNPFRWDAHFENGKKVDFCTWGRGAVSGSVVGADTSTPIAGAQVDVIDTKSGETVRTKYTDSNGVFEVDNLSPAEYKVVVKATGYLMKEETVTLSVKEITFLPISLMIDQSLIKTGTITGSITNVLNGYGVDDVSYELRKGTNVITGEVVESGVFDSSDFSLQLEIGYYTLSVKKDGYLDTNINVSVSASTDLSYDISLTPENANLSAGNLRIKLTWGDTPQDLDSHLLGPDPYDSSERFHIFFDDEYYWSADEEGNSVEIADLDRDVRNGYGPEHSTVYAMANGLYSFYVHDYSNAEANVSTAMSYSGAKVEVFIGNASVRIFNVPAGREGTLWHVFDYDSVNGQIIPINTFSYEEDDENVGKSNAGQTQIEDVDRRLIAESIRTSGKEVAPDNIEASADEETFQDDVEIGIEIPDGEYTDPAGNGDFEGEPVDSQSTGNDIELEDEMDSVAVYEDLPVESENEDYSVESIDIEETIEAEGDFGYDLLVDAA